MCLGFESLSDLLLPIAEVFLTEPDSSMPYSFTALFPSPSPHPLFPMVGHLQRGELWAGKDELVSYHHGLDASSDSSLCSLGTPPVLGLSPGARGILEQERPLPSLERKQLLLGNMVVPRPLP